MKIAMTGTSGNMGREVLIQTLALRGVEKVRVLLSPRKKNDKLAKQYRRLYGDRVEVLRGSVADEELCKKLVAGMDYVVHMAAVIPPRSDADFKASEECNKLGAIAMVNAVKAAEPQPSYIHISTVALYGNRNEKHPFGRVGDPLLVSAFDCYAMHKLEGERYCLEAGLKRWAVLRQTAMLHPNMMHDNVSDGLMFHTCLNAPLEWVSSRDSGYLIKRILERDGKGEIEDFWKKIYNIGAGEKAMQTGYDTFKDGFGIIGGSAEKFFQPEWLAARNFHGVWFADGGELETLFGYQRDNPSDYWKEIGKHHKLYALGKLVPAKLIDLFLFKRLLKHPNSPYVWKKNAQTDARAFATFGNAVPPKSWKEVKLLAKGDFGDYDKLRSVENAKNSGLLLSHGYDEEKPMEEWDLPDMRSAASFRGGECVSEQYNGPYTKLTWKCHDGHEFGMTPYTVLRGGHWCPVCGQPAPWDFDRLAKDNPFFAQVWYDSHEKDENVTYRYGENGEHLAERFER